MHEGHRNRLVSKVRDGGVVYEHELMEILLFNACPRKDLNAAAHALINEFDTFVGVFRAECSELTKVKGVGLNMAEYIAVLGKALCAVREVDGFAAARNIYEFKRYVLTRPVPEADCTELYCLDKDGRVRRIISFKAKNGLRPLPKETEILKPVSSHSPYGLFAACRVTDGNRRPDELDDILCERIYRIGKLCGARLYDYCVVGGNGGFYSYKMADRGVFADRATGDGYGE